MRFQGKVALITGAARGIGRVVAEEFGAEGAAVALNDIDSQALEATAASLRSRGARVFAAAGDVAENGFAAEFVAGAAAALGSVDILVNNAGISPKHRGRKALVADMARAEWEQVLRVNLTGPFLLCRAVIPLMRTRGWGRIINMSSQAGRTGTNVPGAHYMASKAGVLGLTRCLALELAAYGITVNAVCPGRIESDMMAAAGDELNRAILARIPVGRFGTPADVAHAVLFLADPRSSFITGVALDVNGGSFMC